MSSLVRLLMKRLLLSAAVKKILVRLVSTRTTSSESGSVSSFAAGVAVGVGEGADNAGSVTRLVRDFSVTSVWANIVFGSTAPPTNRITRHTANTSFLITCL